MAQAAIVQVAEDVVEQINKKQGGWSQKFNAVRRYRFKSQLEETDQIIVQVGMVAWRAAPDNRTDWSHEFDIDIGIQWRADAKAGDQATEKFDELMKLLEEMSDYWEATRPSAADCPLIHIAFGAGGDQPYIPDHIESLNQFTGAVRLTFQKLRDPDE